MTELYLTQARDFINAARLVSISRILIAGWIGIVSAAISSVCAVSSSTDRSSSDAYGHPTAYGCTTVNATVVDTTVINASTTNTSTTATAVRKGVS